MVCLGTVVPSSADFEITVTMALAVLVSCADSGGRTPSKEQQTPTTIATLQVPVFMIL
jgi:hypothetical protein